MLHYFCMTSESSKGVAMRSLLHSFIASMTIIGLPGFLRCEENKTQEIIYHFTAFFSFIIMFKPQFDLKSKYLIPTISFSYRKSPKTIDEDFNTRESRYNMRLVMLTLVGAFMYKVGDSNEVTGKQAGPLPRILFRQYDIISTALETMGLHA